MFLPYQPTHNGELQMSIQTVNVKFWFQSTGLTGQNLSESNQNKYARVNAKMLKKRGIRLSKMACYKASRVGARKVKDEFGTRIGSNSITTFEMVLTGVDKFLDGKNNNIDLTEFGVNDIVSDLTCANVGRWAS
tara:strand:+ start:315 stop:716 length:402 start_codon:yes stop_codon:yes gene_type:complete